MENLQPTAAKTKTKSVKVFAKWWFWVIIGVVILVIISAVGSALSRKNSNDEESNDKPQETSKLAKVDVNGLTIKEACEKVREAGWRVSEVAGNNNYSEKSDCSDTERKVANYSYHTDKYYSWGDEDPNYESVVLYFANQAKETTPNTDTEAPAENNSDQTSNSTTTTTQTSTNSTSQNNVSASSGYQAIYDEYAAKLRAECPTLSMSDCAALSNDGVSKMAEYMYKASGTDGQYQAYSDWAGKLYDVYMDSVQ